MVHPSDLLRHTGGTVNDGSPAGDAGALQTADATQGNGNDRGGRIHRQRTVFERGGSCRIGSLQNMIALKYALLADRSATNGGFDDLADYSPGRSSVHQRAPIVEHRFVVVHDGGHLVDRNGRTCRVESGISAGRSAPASVCSSKPSDQRIAEPSSPSIFSRRMWCRWVPRRSVRSPSSSPEASSPL